MDWDGPIPDANSDNAVVVDPPQCPLCQEHLEALSNCINPLDDSQEYGIDVYVECLQFVRDRTAVCSHCNV